MRIVKTVKELQKVISKSSLNKKIGFIPTMGSLHKGHVSLISSAKSENTFVIVSIFVNPTQFDEAHDYESYPHNINIDAEHLQKIDIDCLYIPDVKTMYPNSNDFSIQSNKKMAHILEGKARPGHFSGMLIIILKFLLLIKPHYAYFGEKDYQQAILIKQMVESFFIQTKIVICPTVRTESGLPFSSRNVKLTKQQKEMVTDIYHTLKKVNFSNLCELKEKINFQGADIEYLEEIDNRIFLAMRIGTTRLIDNFSKETGPC